MSLSKYLYPLLVTRQRSLPLAIRESPSLSSLRMASMTTQSATSTSQMVLRNVLADSKSPYLLQHKDNPVAVSSTQTLLSAGVRLIHPLVSEQWQEFTPETIALAREMDRPIFLSSGYSACHWWVYTISPCCQCSISSSCP